jgi:hypothetical protein
MSERKLLRITRPPGAEASMVIDGTEYTVVRIKVRGDLIEVLFDGREDHAADQDAQPQERWKALKGWLQDRIRSLEADAGDWQEHAYMAETFRAKADAYRSALAQMTEQEAGR